MGLQDHRLTSKSIDAPQAVFAVTQKRKPRRAVGSRAGPVVLLQHATHHIFMNINAESLRDLTGDPLIAEAGIPAFHFDDDRD